MFKRVGLRAWFELSSILFSVQQSPLESRITPSISVRAFHEENVTRLGSASTLCARVVSYMTGDIRPAMQFPLLISTWYFPYIGGPQCIPQNTITLIN